MIMKKAQKAVVALALSFEMIAMLLMQPMVVIAETAGLEAHRENRLSPEDQGFVSIRAAFDDESVTITWNRAERNIHISFYDICIVFSPGSTVAFVNDEPVEMQHTIILDQGTAYIHFLDLLLVMNRVASIYFTEFAEEEPFRLYLSEESRDIVLYDFEFLISAITENTPWESVINRRLNINFMEHMSYLRDHIESLHPLTFRHSLEEFEELHGAPLYELWFPIREGDDPRYNAATYLSYLLIYGMNAFDGIGHLSPRDTPLYRIQYRNLKMFDYLYGLDREVDPFNAMRLDILTHPNVVWFYGDVEVDFSADMSTIFPEIPDNIITEIISPGEVAYLRIGSFLTSAEIDDLTIAPFFEEIQDFGHLIIDIRGNGGGFLNNFTHNVMGRLISQPVEVISHQFFSGGDIAVMAMNALVESTQNRFDSVESNLINQWYTINVMPARQFITRNGMMDFNQDDLALLEYVKVERNWIFPNEDGITFNGKVWLLVDSRSASASSEATLLLMNTGLATVVGENTSGVMGTNSTYIILPSTGILFRIDVGYRTDASGNSLEVYGIAPHVRNFAGMDALETTLELIAGYDANEWHTRLAEFNLRDMMGDYDVDLTDHPLTGVWAWDVNDSFIYEFRADGTGVRGFDNNRIDITWFADDNNLFIDVGYMIEHWTFTIYDGVLTIVSAQVFGMTWSYISVS